IIFLIRNSHFDLYYLYSNTKVREKNLNSERLNSIYSDVENAKKIIKWGAIIGGSICFILLIFVICLIFIFVY
ncbi:hypothetical protein DWX22_08245, partial [Coprococcus sp. AF18-48]